MKHEHYYAVAQSLVVDHRPICGFGFGDFLAYAYAIITRLKKKNDAKRLPFRSLTVRFLTLGYDGSREDLRLRMTYKQMLRLLKAMWDCHAGEQADGAPIAELIASAKNYFAEVRTGSTVDRDGEQVKSADGFAELGHNFFKNYHGILSLSGKASYVPLPGTYYRPGFRFNRSLRNRKRGGASGSHV